MRALSDNLISKHYNWRLLLSSGLLTLSSMNYAMDNQGFAQTQAMKPFVQRFGQKTAKGAYALPPQFLSYSNSFPFIVQVFGILLGSWLSNRYGRRFTVFFMSVWALCCIPIFVTAEHKAQILAGRCLNSLYIGMEMSTIPIFQAEIVPGAVRGLAVGSYQMSFGAGGLIMSGICHQTASLTSDWAWRIPLMCMMVVPIIVSSLIWFQPESPRWLLTRGRTVDARNALRKYRLGTEAEVDLELEQISLAIAAEKAIEQGTFWDLFRHGNLRRTMIMVITGFMQQACGQVFTSLYGPVIVSGLGTIPVFNYTLINASLGFVTLLLVIFVADKIGRRPIMITGMAIQGISMFIIAGLGGTQHPTHATKSVTLAFIVIYGLAFSGAWAPLSYVVIGEIPSQHLRMLSSRVAFLVTQITQFITSFSLPYAVYAPGNLGYKVGYIYAPVCLIGSIWAWFFLPECKGLRLEQVDLMFNEHVPAWRSAKWSRENKDRLIEANVEEPVGRGLDEDEKHELEMIEDIKRV